MGRRKKNVDLVEVGNVKTKISPEEEQLQINMKKWEKIINKAFNQKTQTDEESLYEKIKEKFQSDQEVKDIISELFIKLKNCDYFVKKQWHTLKKFNLQEKIFREESKIIRSNEKQKINEIYIEAIEKLAAFHVSGFEPLDIIRSKILNKIQIKYSISEENMKELSEQFNSAKELDENLNLKRSEDQRAALQKMIDLNQALFNYKEVDKNTYLDVKTRIKKYEKELESKANQNEQIEDTANTGGVAAETNYKMSDLQSNPNKVGNINEEIPFEDENNNDNKIKISDFFKADNNDEKIIQEIKEEAETKFLGKKKERENNSGETNNKKEYKSEILNNFDFKLKKFGKLSDFDIHVLLYIFHTVTNELIAAKNSKKDYVGEIDPLEITRFLKQYKSVSEILENKENNDNNENNENKE